MRAGSLLKCVAMVAVGAVAFCASGRAWAAGDIRTVSIDGVNRDADNNIVSFNISFGTAAAGEVDTLYLAYGTSDGGSEMANWDHVDLKRRIVADETKCVITAPTGVGVDISHVRAFLKSGYTPLYDMRLDTIKSVSGIVDTGWVPDQNTRVWADIEATAGQEYWFGCWGNAYNNKAYAFRGNGSNNYYNGFGNGFRGNQNYKRCSGRHVIWFNKSLGNGQMEVSITPTDPAKVDCATNWTYAVSTFSAERTMYLFGFHAANATQYGASETLREVKMWDDDVLVRHFVPCVKGDKAMMYDALNGVLYSFSGGTQTRGTAIAAEDDDLVTPSTGGQSASPVLAYVKYPVTAVVVPSQAGRVYEGAVQSVDSGSSPKPFKVMPVSAAVTFVGWRLAGTQQILSTDYTYQHGTISGATALEAIFNASEPSYRFVARYDSAAPAGGDGFTWAKAYNNMDNAIRAASYFGGEVWVKGGTHRLSSGFSIVSNTVIHGGFEGIDGKFATVEAEWQARDCKTHESVFSQYAIVQKNKADETAVVEGVTFTSMSSYAVYIKNDTGSDYSSPTFSNCVFRGSAAVWVNSRWSQATFSSCRFEAVTGGSYGRIFFESSGGGVVNLTDCDVVCVTNGGYGAFNFASGSGRFERCRFIRNVSTGGTSPAIVVGRYSVSSFYDCQFIGNTCAVGAPLTRFATMVGCTVASNSVSVTGSKESVCDLLYATATPSRCYRTAIYDNTVSSISPNVTSGNVWARLFSVASLTLVDCTVARNICSVDEGTGYAARSAAAVFSSGTYGGVVNCTFVDNRMQTADIVDNGFTTCAVPLVNDIFWNDRTDYVSVKATSAGTMGFQVKNTIAREFDATVAHATTVENVSTVNPQFVRKPVLDAAGRLAYPVRRPGPAAGKGLDVTAGANLCFAIGSDSAWSGGNPSAPVTLIPDIAGLTRESGKFNLGSTQIVDPSGLAVIVK